MSQEQLCLFKFSRPLVDLLGPGFFDSVPRAPGVYLFRGDRERVLYVGQSKNLRLRLAYYKNARPEREPRRIIRLVHQTRRIELLPCDTPAAAEARELELIQEHQPRFNVRHALSRTYSFFAVRLEESAFRIRLSLESAAREDGESVTGAFKNRGLCRRALFAIGRTVWSAACPVHSVFAFPVWLIDRTRLNEMLLPLPAASEEVLQLLRGSSDILLRRTEERLGAATDPCLRSLYESDLLLLTEFHTLAVRMKELRQSAGAETLPQREVDRIQLACTRRSSRISKPVVDADSEPAF